MLTTNEMLRDCNIKVFGLTVLQYFFMVMAIFMFSWFFTDWNDYKIYSGVALVLMSYRSYVLAIFISKEYTKDIAYMIKESMPRKYRRKMNKQ